MPFPTHTAHLHTAACNKCHHHRHYHLSKLLLNEYAVGTYFRAAPQSTERSRLAKNLSVRPHPRDACNVAAARFFSSLFYKPVIIIPILSTRYKACVVNSLFLPPPRHLPSPLCRSQHIVIPRELSTSSSFTMQLSARSCQTCHTTVTSQWRYGLSGT